MVSKSTEFCIENSPCNDRSLGMRYSIAVRGNGVHNKGFALVNHAFRIKDVKKKKK